MNTRRVLVTMAFLAFVIALSACGSDAVPAGAGGPSAAAPSTGSTAAVSVSPEPTPVRLTNPTAIARALKAAVGSEIGAVVTMTEDNDANELFGRPGQYDAVAFLEIKRFGCDGPDFDELNTECGAKIERWPSKADAMARKDDIQNKLKAYGLGAEWDYVSGRLLLRVAGDVRPSAASRYEAAFRVLVE